MAYPILKLLHVIGVVVIGAGLIGVWVSDMRSRQCRELVRFSEAVRNIAVFYDGLVVPGALLLLVSGTWLIVEFFGGWSFVETPWLAGMVELVAQPADLALGGGETTMIEYQNLFTRVQVRTTTPDWGVAIEDDTWRRESGIDTKSGLSYLLGKLGDYQIGPIHLGVTGVASLVFGILAINIMGLNFLADVNWNGIGGFVRRRTYVHVDASSEQGARAFQIAFARREM